MPRFLIELPADEPECARRFWQELLQTTLESRRPEEGHGWQPGYEGIVFGLHDASGHTYEVIDGETKGGILYPKTRCLDGRAEKLR